MKKVNTQPLLLKFGGSALEAPSKITELLQAVQTEFPNRPCAVIHGGGALVDTWLAQLGLVSEKIAGQRVTPEAHIPYVVGALAGYSNQLFIQAVQQAGKHAVGLSLADHTPLPLIQVRNKGAVALPLWDLIELAKQNKKTHYGYFLQSCLEQGWTPVISSIGRLANGALVNVNADYAAAALSYLLSAELVLLSDVPAILNAQGEALSEISLQLGYELLDAAYIQGGMKVKLESALEVTQRSRRTTAITGWQNPEQVIALLHGAPVGTRIIY